ncbi:hypothetical protein BDZ89DRAFT_1144856 [Hymenopellis radicata]|nr:hypothetical protein BDZ89DRAFT_1144856 [Hymenopellis radicata]
MPRFNLSPPARNLLALIAIRDGSWYLAKKLRAPSPDKPPATSDGAHKAADRKNLATGPHSETLITAVVACVLRSPCPNAPPVGRNAPIHREQDATRQIAGKGGLSVYGVAALGFRPGTCPFPTHFPAAHTNAYARSLCGLCHANRGATKATKKNIARFLLYVLTSPILLLSPTLDPVPHTPYQIYLTLAFAK